MFFAHGFFSKTPDIRRVPPPRIAKYPNTTFWKSFCPSSRKHRQTFVSNKKNVDQRKEERPASLNDKVRGVFLLIGRVLYAIKATAAVFAIRIVLSLKMERPVLSRLSPDVLIFLLEVSVHNQQIIHLVAKELSGRIAPEICSFTGKDSYKVGDISKAIVARYTGSEEYRFGDVTRSTWNKILGWMREHEEKEEPPVLFKNLSGFGTKKEYSSKEMESILYKISSKKDYEFGDVTRSILKRMNDKSR